MGKGKNKELSKYAEGIDKKTLEGLYALSEVKSITHLYEAIKAIKYIILRDEFSYPEAKPTRNAINKAFYKGGDYFLTTLVKLIKGSPAVLDSLEETKEKRGKAK